ncbi:bifunctional orotidine-5'-phosphate decarboxylase/orotate phosphoribosyltransferase [Cyanobium sp. Cruz CV13-4-11]|jgi:uridine monophosphate synthetase|uniref:bifunctional orotidine-5'-phosphate decarboxylase/orotate phosphoribosyltransferase n=1 Tax=unclassified Cyanobium TaxID=2627006 RepID=UPI0020CB6FDA|nr:MULTISPECIES: bifunctional orotidine-5'-phosphate decarboxylase/orotate phosphoribosyltransferase [unclassified Cyanobium]MCP9899835.1 bifunctional orotidine-5'-phosphate decarboxylase/orotate phosphoribosyltransferase [Cyanobium sp. Cruz CV11-17]MCP9918866.1 bifunctional orotidine-5'-phosphate decarboxylase/orotate phosphoribosyltransferase [Cyanobium sp. Cruz CV13-4-11]
MGFFVQLTDAIAARQSLLVTGLDPNPEMLQAWAHRRGMGGRSFLSQARHWIKAVVEATADHVCAYKPSLGFYQALGPVGLELLREVRELVPLDIPLIIDAKHGDLNSSSALAHYLFRELGADGVTLSPLAGQDIAAPFLLYPDKAVVITCHSSNAAARVLQHHPDESDPLYLRIVRECQLWATPDQLLLEVGTSDPEILARVRQEAPERFLILRSLWGEEDRLDALLEAGLSPAADGLLMPLPQNLLVEDDIAERSAALKQRISERRDRWLEGRSRDQSDICSLWLPGRQPEGGAGIGAASNGDGGGDGIDDPLASLILDLFDIGCLLFGDYVQASGAVFNYYVDLRQIISDPNLFHRVLHAYAGQLGELVFDRIAGIPYGSLPTATGLSLQLHKPLLYPRKEVKAHGARRLIEGDFEEGDRVVVVDDILITGGSVLEGIAKLESSGLEVEDVVVFIDHGGKADTSARQRLARAGYRCHAVLDIERITNVLHGAGRLSDGQAATLGHTPPGRALGVEGLLASS